MKKILVSLFLFASVSAFAQPANNDVQNSISSTNVVDHFPTSTPDSSVSRAQVQSDLAQAQKDGSLQSIKSWGRGGH